MASPTGFNSSIPSSASPQTVRSRLPAVTPIEVNELDTEQQDSGAHEPPARSDALVPFCKLPTYAFMPVLPALAV